MKHVLVLFATFLLPLPAAAQVTSVFGRTGVVTAKSGDYTCSQVTNCGPTNGANTWTQQNKFSLNGTSTTSPTNYPIVVDSFAGGAVSPRNSTIMQWVGSPNITNDAEVNLDAFAYNGELQWDAERYDRGTLLTNGSTSTSSPTLHIVNNPTAINANTTIYDNGQTIGTVASTTSPGSTTITLTANAAYAVASGDTLAWIGPGNGAVQSGEGVGCYTFEPFDGSSDSNTAQMCANATETQAHGTNNGTRLTFSYTPNASNGSLRYMGLAISPGGLGGVTVGNQSGSPQVAPTDEGAGTLNVVTNYYLNGTKMFASGTWTPTFSFTGGGGTISSYTEQSGNYRCAGGVVTIDFYVAATINTTGASGQLLINGQPYSFESSNNPSGSIGSISSTFVSYSGSLGLAPSGSSSFRIVATAAGTGSNAFTTSNLTSGSSHGVVGSITYLTATGGC